MKVFQEFGIVSLQQRERTTWLLALSNSAGAVSLRRLPARTPSAGAAVGCGMAAASAKARGPRNPSVPEPPSSALGVVEAREREHQVCGLRLRERGQVTGTESDGVEVTRGDEVATCGLPRPTVPWPGKEGVGWGGAG